MVDITDLGRVLTAMCDEVGRETYPRNSIAYHVQHMMLRTLRAGAAKCAEIAQEQLADVDNSEQTS